MSTTNWSQNGRRPLPFQPGEPVGGPRDFPWNVPRQAAKFQGGTTDHLAFSRNRLTANEEFARTNKAGAGMQNAIGGSWKYSIRFPCAAYRTGNSRAHYICLFNTTTTPLRQGSNLTSNMQSICPKALKLNGQMIVMDVAGARQCPLYIHDNVPPPEPPITQAG